MTVDEFMNRLAWVARVLGHDRVLEIGRMCGLAWGPLRCIPPAVLACAMETLEDRARSELGINTPPTAEKR